MGQRFGGFLDLREKLSACLTESPGYEFETASPHLQGEACFGLFLTHTSLMWEAPALGLLFFYVDQIAMLFLEEW